MRSGGTRTSDRPVPAVAHRARCQAAAEWSFLLGVALCTLAAPFREGVGPTLLLVGLLTLAVAWLAATVGCVVGGHRRLALLPTTRQGWLALALIGVGWAMISVPEALTRQGSQVAQLLGHVILAGMALILIAGMLALWAMWRRDERSAALILIAGFVTLFGPLYAIIELALLR